MIIKTQEEIAILREGGNILGSIMDALIERVRPGVTTNELDAFAEQLMREAGGVSAFKGYKPSFGHEPFPTVLCTSLNEEIVHTPANKNVTLKEGDVLGIDVGFKYKGMFTDMARTVPVGNISAEARRLLLATQDALDAAIHALQIGETLYRVGEAVEHVTKGQFGIVRDLVGHGVGKEIHEAPNVANYRLNEMKKYTVQEGMVLAVEPMLTLGSEDIVLGADKWSYETADGSLSAQFENTVAINYDGTVEILTPTKWRFV